MDVSKFETTDDYTGLKIWPIWTYFGFDDPLQVIVRPTLMSNKDLSFHFSRE